MNRAGRAAVAAVIVAGGALGLGWVIGISDGEAPVAARVLEDVTVVSAAPITPSSLPAQGSPPDSVPSESGVVRAPATEATRVVLPDLREAVGLLRRDDDDFVLQFTQAAGGPSARVELDAGPERWVRSTRAPADVDGDGRVATWWEELDGLVGREVTVLGLLDDGDLDVFVIAGVALRPPYSEVPPWADDWSADDLPPEVVDLLETGLSGSEAVRRALELVPGVVIDAEIDLNDGHPYWEVDVRATDGAVYDVEIDAVTGVVVELERR